MNASRALRALLHVACALSTACGASSSGKSGGFPADDGGAGEGGLIGGDDAGGLLGDGAGGDDGGAGGGCSKAARYVYAIDVGGAMYQFDPPSLQFTQVGQVSCASSQFFSMAVDRNAVAWVLVQDGTMVRYDINTHACTKTAFATAQSGFLTFGMGFSSDSPGSAAETLFVSDSELTAPSTGGLARIDTSSLALSKVAQYDQLTGRRAEMTGTGDARLFGAFEGSPYVVAEIDKVTAHVKSVAPQSAINYPPDTSNFAFAFWGGDFWLFVGPGQTTDVFQYRPSTNTTTKRTTENFEIVGAGVSTCAPTTPPQ